MRASIRNLALACGALLLPAAAHADPGFERKSARSLGGFLFFLPELPIDDIARAADWPRLLTITEINAAMVVPTTGAADRGAWLAGRSDDLRARAIDAETRPSGAVVDSRIKALRQKARALAAVSPIDQDSTSQ